MPRFKLNAPYRPYNDIPQIQERLEKIGFKFVQVKPYDDCPKTITVPDTNTDVYRDINSLEELMDMVSECNAKIILDKDTIVIYSNRE